jgi:hypothetical protein
MITCKTADETHRIQEAVKETSYEEFGSRSAGGWLSVWRAINFDQDPFSSATRRQNFWEPVTSGIVRELE